MKTLLRCGVWLVLGCVATALAGPRDADWKKVEAAARAGLPKSAIAELDTLYARALADRAYPEAIKALGRKIALEGTIEGNKPEEKIRRLQAELETVPVEMKPALEAILAHWYWHYFRQNRWRFLQRTRTAEAPGPDLQTWDLPRILAEIGRHFDAALADEATLKATPIARYNDLLEKGSVPDSYRPTLFDFLAYEALEFYQSGEQGALEAEDAFELDAAETPIFADAATFVKWQPETTDETSPTLKAIRLYQKLLAFHARDRDRSAFYDAELARLTFGKNTAVGEDKVERYTSALERLVAATGGRHEIYARALAALATQLNEDGDPAKAHATARRGLDAFSKETAGGAACYNLLQQIETRSAQLETERVWNAPWPTLDITYRNLTRVHLRAVRMDFDAYVTRSRWSYGGIDAAQRAELLAAAPALEWSVELPATTDYTLRTEKVPVPTSLQPGFYFLISSFDPEFREASNEISIASAWVSKLALVITTPGQGTGSPGGFVLDARSGEPVSGAPVRIWQQDSEGWFKPVAAEQTDEHGRFHVAASDKSYVALAEHDGHAVSSLYPVYARRNREPEHAATQTVFFTDRALYRPGQAISYKGISLRLNQDAGKYRALAGRNVTVIFRDPNGEEIARATHQTNDFGSFSGVFTAPRDRLLGRMTLHVDEGPVGGTDFSVEEYKRPKFQVELAAPADAAKLGATVRVTGKASAYTGASVGGAKVKWRVERSVRFPLWCWWWQPPASKAIAHGMAVTEPDGTFKIEFSAAPDRTVPAKTEPTFNFTIYADVTDTTGETRSDQRIVRAGYTALQATLKADDWQTPDTPVVFAVETSSLDGDPQPASGVVTLYALQPPATVERSPLPSNRYPWRTGRAAEPADDPSNPDTWELGDAVATHEFKTDVTGTARITAPLTAGVYRAMLETKDRFGKAVTARQTLQVIDPGASHYALKLPNRFASPAWSVEPGDTFTALWGTGYDSGRAFVEVSCDGRMLKSYWTEKGRTQELITLPVTEALRGGFTVKVTYVRENRAYFNTHVVAVPWSNKALAVKWESFRSKLLPGQKETWTAVVTGPDAQGAVAEMAATLYDASLDQYRAHRWPDRFGVFRHEYDRSSAMFQNVKVRLERIWGSSGPSLLYVDWDYRAFPEDIRGGFRRWTYGMAHGGAMADDDTLELSAFAVAAPANADLGYTTSTGGTQRQEALLDSASIQSVPPPPPPEPDLGKVTARRNLNETAFFFPHLLSGDDGVVRMQFEIPEALTTWRFFGFAHDKQLRAGLLTGEAVTSKDIMVEPNPPRFVREGDVIELTVKVSNQSDERQTGKVRLTFADAATLKAADAALGNRTPEQAFDVPAKQSRSYAWRITVPDGQGFLTFKAVGATAQASDGEEGFLPVLSRRILVTESLPLPVRGKGTQEFAFEKLLESGASDTLRHQALTVQMVSQPAWYAVMALPFLMEYPYECSEQVFNRYYANALAGHIAGSDPKIRRIFDLWKGTSALESPLEKNEDLKSLILEETPWLRQAKEESEARRNVGLLFDPNRLEEATSRALRELAERQLSDGLWSWFPGGRPSEYISLYIATGFGRLRHLGATAEVEPALKALSGLDAWMQERHRRILEAAHPEEYVPSPLDALYLYGRSFFLDERPIAGEHREMIDFYLRQSRKFWLRVDNRQSHAHLAIALKRFGDTATPQAILQSLKERSVNDEELGMFWRDRELSWWWYHAPIETQALMIEAFAEVTDDTQAVEDCKVWLLKQKQTQDWKTTKATADAVYALLLRGTKLLASDALVEVSLGGETLKPGKVEAGTGFYEHRFVRDEIKPALGRITVRKTDDGVSWGGVHWQYLEDLAKVTPHEGTPLKLRKTLFVKETTNKGQVLKPVKGPVAVGDELVVRLELRTDRDMEYVHLKDQRGSGAEPVNVLSRYRYQDGLAYYESTRDTATHFFIDYLPKGVYVFEYSVRVQLRGSYQTGVAEIQCMYAPEFNSHSESMRLEVAEERR